jgi:Outer membrane protein beta-barrel domain
MSTGVRNKALGFGVVLSLLAIASPARAQTSSFTVRGEGLIGYQHFLASETFKAVFGTANAPIYGGGLEVGFQKHWLVRVDATRFKKTGERAFVTGGGVVSNLGIPLTVTITPITVVAGYRAPLASTKPPARGSRVPPKKPPTVFWYVAGGAGSWAYSESTDDPAESFSERKTGFLGLGGIEWRFQKYLALGFEGQYASVPNAFEGGVAQQFNEKDMGGGSAVVRIIVGR